MDEVRQQKGTGASDCEPLRGPTRTSTTQSAHRGGRQVTLVKSGRSSQAGQARPVKSGWSSEAGQARLVKLGWASDAAAAGKSVAGGWQMVRARAESRAPQGAPPKGRDLGVWEAASTGGVDCARAEQKMSTSRCGPERMDQEIVLNASRQDRQHVQDG